MAGSMRDYWYKTDAGNDFGLKLDKTNADTLNNQTWKNNLTGILYRLPKNVRPRHILMADSTGTIRRKYIILDKDRFAQLQAAGKDVSYTLPAGDVDAGKSVSPTSFRGESVRDVPRSIDTAKTDGIGGALAP